MILEPLVLTHLTLDMSEVLSGSQNMLEMFDSIASGASYPISRYTKSNFIGSVYDRTTPSDLGTDCGEAEAEKWKTQTPSELHEQLIRAQSPISDVSEGSVSESEEEEDYVEKSAKLAQPSSVSQNTRRLLCRVMPDALRKFSVLKSFKWVPTAHSSSILILKSFVQVEHEGPLF